MILKEIYDSFCIEDNEPMTLECLSYATWTLLCRVGLLGTLSGVKWAGFRGKVHGLSSVFYSLPLLGTSCLSIFHLSLCHSETTRKKSTTCSPGSSSEVLRKMIKKNDSNEHVTTNRRVARRYSQGRERWRRLCCAGNQREQLQLEG